MILCQEGAYKYTHIHKYTYVYIHIHINHTNIPTTATPLPANRGGQGDCIKRVRTPRPDPGTLIKISHKF
jgi:hypothetical protein